MPTIKVRSDDMMPHVKEGYDIPFEAGGFYVYETSKEVVSIGKVLRT
jgi:hypothetical protein